MDEVTFNSAGNRITLLKRRTTPPNAHVYVTTSSYAPSGSAHPVVRAREGGRHGRRNPDRDAGQPARPPPPSSRRWRRGRWASSAGPTTRPSGRCLAPLDDAADPPRRAGRAAGPGRAGGGLHDPAGRLGPRGRGELALDVAAFDLDGRGRLAASAAGPREGPDDLGRRVARDLRALGAERLLRPIGRPWTGPSRWDQAPDVPSREIGGVAMRIGKEGRAMVTRQDASVGSRQSGDYSESTVRSTPGGTAAPKASRLHHSRGGGLEAQMYIRTPIVDPAGTGPRDRAPACGPTERTSARRWSCRGWPASRPWSPRRPTTRPAATRSSAAARRCSRSTRRSAGWRARRSPS